MAAASQLPVQMWRVQRTGVSASEVSRSSRRCDGHACRPNNHTHSRIHARTHARTHYCAYGHVRLKRTRVWENVLLELIALARDGERDRRDHRVRKHAESAPRSASWRAASLAQGSIARRWTRRPGAKSSTETGGSSAAPADRRMESRPYRVAALGLSIDRPQVAAAGFHVPVLTA